MKTPANNSDGDVWSSSSIGRIQSMKGALASMNSERFTKHLRLRKRDEFTRVYQSRIFAANECLVVTGIANDLPYSRIGIVTSKKVGNAVERNRWKRVIRESFRQQRSLIPRGLDLIVRPRKGATCDSNMIRHALLDLAKRIAKKTHGAADLDSNNR